MCTYIVSRVCCSAATIEEVVGGLYVKYKVVTQKVHLAEPRSSTADMGVSFYTYEYKNGVKEADGRFLNPSRSLFSLKPRYDAVRL